MVAVVVVFIGVDTDDVGVDVGVDNDTISDNAVLIIIMMM